MCKREFELKLKFQLLRFEWMGWFNLQLCKCECKRKCKRRLSNALIR